MPHKGRRSLLRPFALQTVFLVFPRRISVFLTSPGGFPTSPAEPRRSVDSETHLGKRNQSSGSRDRPRGSCTADCISCISTAYFCISDVPGRISDLTSRTASIRRFRNSPSKVKSEFWIKSYDRLKINTDALILPAKRRIT